MNPKLNSERFYIDLFVYGMDHGHKPIKSNTLTLKPASKTGKAYLRILTYAKKHKRDIYNPTINVQLDKTTLKYTDINGSHTVVCYANNQNQLNNANYETVLHY